MEYAFNISIELIEYAKSYQNVIIYKKKKNFKL